MKPLRVLIVEDEALIAMLYSEVLASLGHDACAIAGTEEEAVEAAGSVRPDLMIVDMHLRQGDGRTAVNRILADGFVPHIYVSGDPPRIRDRENPEIHLQKPFNDAQLIRAIEQAIAQESPAPQSPPSPLPEFLRHRTL